MSTNNSNIVKKRRIEAVIKLTERCNINCSYCYMFNQGSDGYLSHPKQITDEAIQASVKFLVDGARDLDAKVVRVIFHGGEPMMLGYQKFDEICAAFRNAFDSCVGVELEFSMQTNGTLVDKRWLELLATYDVGVGISLDGGRSDNDALRIDHQGKGTYDRTIQGLRMLQDASVLRGKGSPGLLCVINPDRDARQIYRHFVDDLGVQKISFLLPMESHESAPPGQSKKLEKYLLDLFEEWTSDDNPKIRIRLFNEVLTFFMLGDRYQAYQLDGRQQGNVVLTIATNGELGMSDELKGLNISWPTQFVQKTSLSNYMTSMEAVYMDSMYFSLPTKCKPCAWQSHCLGGLQFGSVINRYDAERGFDNASVYCDALRSLYSKAASHLLSFGVEMETIEAAVRTEKFPGSVPSLPVAVRPPSSPLLEGKAVHFIKQLTKPIPAL